MNDIQSLKRVQRINRIPLNGSTNKRPSFRVQIKRFVTNVDGTIQDKNAFLPDAAKIRYPVYMFNAFDEAGGYYAGLKTYPPEFGFFLNHFTYRGAFDLLSFSGANNVKEQFTAGDQILMFSDSEQFPSYFVWVVISCELRAYASILNNPLEKGLPFIGIQYSADNDAQFYQDLTFVEQNEIGNIESDGLSPLTFKTPDYAQDGFIVIPLNQWRLTNWRGIYTYIDFNCDQMDLIFRYIKDF